MMVASGRYNNASGVVRSSLRALEAEEQSLATFAFPPGSLKHLYRKADNRAERRTARASTFEGRTRMKQWEIWTCDFAEAEPHPAVVVSHPDRVARAPLVNVLIGSSPKASRPARRTKSCSTEPTDSIGRRW